MLFKGKVSAHHYDTIDGFTVGETELIGTGDYENHTYLIKYKNENMISYLDGKVDVTVPDLICTIDSDGVPPTNPYAEEGQELSVFGLPSPDVWKTPRGMSVFGPRAFGYDVDYIPIKGN
jgi:DUF917 family protein